jgi:hypothetical protein
MYQSLFGFVLSGFIEAKQINSYHLASFTVNPRLAPFGSGKEIEDVAKIVFPLTEKPFL